MEGLNRDLEEKSLEADGLSKLSTVDILIGPARKNERRKEAAM